MRGALHPILATPYSQGPPSDLEQLSSRKSIIVKQFNECTPFEGVTVGGVLEPVVKDFVEATLGIITCLC